MVLYERALRMGVSLQIQTVVYKMDKDSLYRSLNSIANAVFANRKRGAEVDRVKVVHGDSSPEPVLTEQEVAHIKDAYGDAFDYTYIFFNENTGTSKGQNAMFELCDCDYVVVQNPDIQYSPTFFEHMLRPFSRSDVKCGLVEARQTPIEHPKEYDTKTLTTCWSTGACIMVSSAVFREVGGFDADSFFLYCDDVDLSWRLRLAGYSLVYQPLAPVYHPKYLSVEGNWMATDAEEYYSALASMLMAHKWSYPQRCEAIYEELAASDDEVLVRAVCEFDQRKAENRLPEPRDPQHRISDINTKYGYGKMRFFV